MSAVRGGGFVQCGLFSDKGCALFWFKCALFGAKNSGFFEMQTFWCKKLRIFRYIWCVRTDKGDWASVDILWTRRRGSIFRDFVRTSFMD